ncbi:MAG: ABC transporter permease [Zetaproteobacteria bacterium]|nr:ABC transporter permease [Zetaproteobacteria bacterium]
MDFRYFMRRFINGITLMFGVTMITFILMVYYGPDQTYALVGKNPSPEDIANIRHKLGYDLPFFTRYLNYLREIITADFGYSTYFNEKVSSIFSRTAPVSFLVSLPGFVLGNVLSILLACLAVFYRGKWVDKVVMIFAVMGMSISLIIVLLAFQIIFCTSVGLNWFPVQGWDVTSFSSYLKYVTVPTLSTVFVALGYNTRFYRSIIADEYSKHYVRTAYAFGVHPWKIMLKHVMRNTMVTITTRLIYTLPFLLISGSLVVESFFNIPGIGRITYEAMTTGDLPIVKAMVSLTTVIYVGIFVIIDIVYRLVDPRVSVK